MCQRFIRMDVVFLLQMCVPFLVKVSKIYFLVADCNPVIKYFGVFNQFKTAVLQGKKSFQKLIQ